MDDMRKYNGGHSTAGRAGRKKTITDERFRRKPRTLSLNDYEYKVIKHEIAYLKSNPCALKNALIAIDYKNGNS